MRLFKKLCAVVCALAIVMSFAGCHKKGEIAIKVGDVEFTSAYYMCALVMADSQARNKVAEELGDEASSSEEIDYYSHKIDDKSYVDWVKDTAIDTIKKVAAYKTLCKKTKIELDDETLSSTESMANYYWSNYGYQTILENNGVSFETYKSYMNDTNYASKYFEYLYGKGGEKEVDAAEVEAKMYENFEIADMINASFSDKGEDEIAEIKDTFSKYLEEINSNTRTFEEIYKEYNNITDAEESESVDGATDEETSKPLDEYASLLGSEDTDYASEHFETVKGMAVDEVKLVELDDDAGIVLIKKKDIKADPYYLENLDLTVRYMIKSDENDKEIEKYIKTLDFKEYTYATGQFKVKKIVYPTN